MGGTAVGTGLNAPLGFGEQVAREIASMYLVGPVAGAMIAVGVAYVLRGPATVQEAIAALGTPLSEAPEHRGSAEDHGGSAQPR
jgi:aspartate ammonia-lyase